MNLSTLRLLVLEVQPGGVGGGGGGYIFVPAPWVHRCILEQSMHFYYPQIQSYSTSPRYYVSSLFMAIYNANAFLISTAAQPLYFFEIHPK